jgi:hypothetical protein
MSKLSQKAKGWQNYLSKEKVCHISESQKQKEIPPVCAI